MENPTFDREDMIKAVGSKFPLARETSGDGCDVEKIISCSTHTDLKPTWVHRDMPSNPYRYTSNLFVKCQANEDSIGKEGQHGRCELEGDIVVNEENEDAAEREIKKISLSKSKKSFWRKCNVFGKHYHGDLTHIKPKCFSRAEDMGKIVNKIAGIATRH